MKHASLAIFAILISAQPSLADPKHDAIDAVFSAFKSQCVAAQESFGADPALSELTLEESNIYEMQITPDNRTATIVYNAFKCTNIGYAWCGNGGCGYYVIVDDLVFERAGGYEPFSITQGDQTYVMMPLHGNACVDASDVSGAGPQDCIVVATWDEQARTFRSKDGELQLSNLLD